jgi:hypothetical protein
MAKALVVEHAGKSLPLNLDKVDRARLYGYVETEVLDDQGRKCELATVSGDGHTLVGKGGTAIAQLSPTGLWRQRTELKPVDPQGTVLVPVKSSFDAPVSLEKKATIDEYLSHNIHLVYRLTSDGDMAGLVDHLKDGTIFTFPFSYRGGVEAYAGFLLLGADGNLFLTVGTPTNLQFVGLQEPIDVPEEEAALEEEDALDFAMV